MIWLILLIGIIALVVFGVVAWIVAFQIDRNMTEDFEERDN